MAPFLPPGQLGLYLAVAEDNVQPAPVPPGPQLASTTSTWQCCTLRTGKGRLAWGVHGQETRKISVVLSFLRCSDIAAAAALARAAIDTSCFCSCKQMSLLLLGKLQKLPLWGGKKNKTKNKAWRRQQHSFPPSNAMQGFSAAPYNGISAAALACDKPQSWGKHLVPGWCLHNEERCSQQ